MLTERRARVLKLIVDEYIQTAVPVGSEAIVRRHGLPVSPATIRNEMAELEAEGYVTHPHTSAGRIPSHRGYRYYVESLMVAADLSDDEKRTIRHQFHQAARETDEWSQLAASILARAARNIAIVTYPRSTAARFRHVHLVAVQEFVALMILVLQQARLHQQLLTMPSACNQDELDVIANHLNHLLSGLTARDSRRRQPELSSAEEQVTQAILGIMESEDAAAYGQPYLDGIRLALQQPEFASSDKLLSILEVLDEGQVYRSLPLRAAPGSVKITIGEENAASGLKEYSIVSGEYGLPDQMEGMLGVLGPTRMHYAHTVATVRYLSLLMSELVATYYAS